MTTNRWYTRKVGNTVKLGLTDTEGDTLDAGLTYYVYGNSYSDDLTQEDDTLPIPEEFALAFCKGIANDILQTSGTANPLFMQEYGAMEEILRLRNLIQGRTVTKLKRPPTL